MKSSARIRTMSVFMELLQFLADAVHKFFAAFGGLDMPLASVDRALNLLRGLSWEFSSKYAFDVLDLMGLP